MIVGKALPVNTAVRARPAARALRVPFHSEPLCLPSSNTRLSLEGKGEISGDSSEDFLFLHPSISQYWTLNPVLSWGKTLNRASSSHHQTSSVRLHKACISLCFLRLSKHRRVFVITLLWYILGVLSNFIFILCGCLCGSCFPLNVKHLKAFSVLRFVTYLKATGFFCSPRWQLKTSIYPSESTVSQGTLAGQKGVGVGADDGLNFD